MIYILIDSINPTNNSCYNNYVSLFNIDHDIGEEYVEGSSVREIGKNVW